MPSRQAVDKHGNSKNLVSTGKDFSYLCHVSMEVWNNAYPGFFFQKWFSTQWVNSSILGQNGRHFAHDTFKCIIINEMFCVLNRISVKFIPKGLNYNKSTLVQVMAWCRPGDKPLPGQMMTQPTDACIYAALGRDELSHANVIRCTHQCFTTTISAGNTHLWLVH